MGGALITVTPLPVISNVSVSPALCNGSSNGSITITAGSGTPPYTYSIDGGGTFQTGNVFAGLPQGTNYNLVVTDILGCASPYQFNPVRLTQPNSLVQVDSAIDASCGNVFDGTITITATGGVSPYSYSLNGGPSQPGNIFTGLASGSYIVTVQDANGCTDTAHTDVGSAYAVSGSLVAQTNVSCYGGTDGTVSVQLSRGLSPYTYSINGFTFQSTSTFTGLTAGNYTVTLRDSRGCTAFVPVTITQPGPLVLAIDSLQNVLCNGQAQGAIFIHVNGGAAPYSFIWSNGATSQNVTNLAAGTFNVTVLDAKGCNSSTGATISEPLPLFLNIATYHNLSCFNDSSGYIYINTSGGMPPYSYAWSNSATTQDISGLSQGTYNLTVNDINGCVQTIAQALTQPQQLHSGISGTNVTCSGNSNGNIALSVSGGTGPYTYLWSSGDTTQNLNNVPASNYFVVIHDVNNCSTVNEFNVTQPQPITITTVITQISCFNTNTGAIQLTATGGSPGYFYAWSTGQSDSIQTGLASGLYEITVTDSHTCSAITTVNLINPPALNDNMVARPPLCSGDSNGVINLIPSGGEPPYAFLWSNQDTTEHQSNLTPGMYVVTITDSRNCSIVDSVNIISPAPLVTSGLITNVSCSGDTNGAVYVTVYGGTLPYNYDWSNHSSTQNIIGVLGGTYFITITDAGGCQAVSRYVVVQPSQLTLSLTGTNVLCFGDNTGSIAAVAGGGTTPYTYLWRNAASGATQTGLSQGLYGLELVDSSGCRAFDSILVTQPTQIQISAQIGEVQCFGASTGAITLSVTGGMPGYNFLWSTGATMQNLNAVAANTYHITVTDLNLCAVTDSFDIQQGNEMIIALAANPPVCYEGTTGYVSASVNGGTAPYRYLWNTFPADTGILASHLSAGSYNVTVTDHMGCTASSGAVLTKPQPLTVATLSSGSRCFNSATGQVIANASGGTPQYNYLLNGASQSTDTFTRLFPGNYDILVLDVNGCQGKDSFSITSNNPISVSLSASDAVILTGMQTRLSATATSDAAIIDYIWSPITIDSTEIINYADCTDTFNCSSPYVKPPFTTVFSVTAMNADSCYATDTITISVNKSAASFIPTAFTPNNDGLNDRFQFAILEANNIDVTIYNRWGELVFHNPNQTNSTTGNDGWDGFCNGRLAPTDTYVYKMTISYFDGTTEAKSGTITLVR
jgi:gliding motility-associated-like protein